MAVIRYNKIAYVGIYTLFDVVNKVRGCYLQRLSDQILQVNSCTAIEIAAFRTRPTNWLSAFASADDGVRSDLVIFF